MGIQMKDDSRKLATIRVVDEILPITDADAIELARFVAGNVLSRKAN